MSSIPLQAVMEIFGSQDSGEGLLTSKTLPAGGRASHTQLPTAWRRTAFTLCASVAMARSGQGHLALVSRESRTESLKHSQRRNGLISNTISSILETRDGA